jgi:hypothetical protein
MMMKSFWRTKLLGLVLATSVALQAAPLFPDVPENHWAKDAVAALAAKGLVEGYPDGTFKGDRSASRWETAMIVARLLAKMEQAHATFATKAELDELRKLVNALREELDALGVRVTNLEEDVELIDRRVTELERITFYGELNVRAGSQSFTNDGADSMRSTNPGIVVDSINYHNAVGSVVGAGGIITNPTSPINGLPNNYFITGVPTVTNWLTGTPLTNGTTFTTRAMLGLNIKVSDDIDAGAEFVAYSSMGDQVVDAFWGLSAPYQSNAFTGQTSTGFGAAGAFNQPLNNTPYTRMTLDNFWVKHKSSGTKLIVGSFGSTDFDGNIYSLMPNPNPTGPANLNSFGFQVTGRHEFEEGERPLALSWEVMGTKLPDGNVSLVLGDSYYTHAEGGNIALHFNNEKGEVQFNFLRAAQDASGGAALNVGAIQFPNLISGWVNPNGFYAGQINNASHTAGIGTTSDIRPVPTFTGADGATGLPGVPNVGGIGPQGQTMYGLSAEYMWSDNEFRPHVYGEYSHSNYKPSKNSGYSVDGDLFRIGAGASFFDETLDVDVHYLSVDPTYDPFVLQYPTVGGLTQPNWRIPDLNNFWNTYSLHDTATYPHNREGIRAKINWKFNERGTLAFHYGNLQQVQTSLQDVRYGANSLGAGVPNSAVLGFSPGFTDPVFLGLSPFTFANSGGNAFGTVLENPKGEMEHFTVIGSHKWLTDEEENRGVTLSGLYLNYNYNRNSNLSTILQNANGLRGENQNYYDFTISGWNIGLAYDVTPDFEVKGAYTQLDVFGHIDPLGVYNNYAAATGSTRFNTWDVTQQIPEIGFNWKISEKTSWDMNFKYYDMNDNMSSAVTPSPTVPSLNVAAGPQSGHPFDWSGVQVMTNYSLKF